MGGAGGTVKGEEAWAVVLLGLGLLLGLFWGCLHLGQRGESRVRQSDGPPRLQSTPSGGNGGGGGGCLTSLVLASPFSEWFSSFASASAFSFAFLVFLSSFLSFTAFSFCGGTEHRCRLLRGGEQSHSGWGGGLLPLLLSWPLVQAWAGPVSMTTTEKNQASTACPHCCVITGNFPLCP